MRHANDVRPPLDNSEGAALYPAPDGPAQIVWQLRRGEGDQEGGLPVVPGCVGGGGVAARVSVGGGTVGCAFAMLTGIFCGWASGDLGSVSVSTPFSYLAWEWSASTALGSVISRLNEAAWRSRMM